MDKAFYFKLLPHGRQRAEVGFFKEFGQDFGVVLHNHLQRELGGRGDFGIVLGKALQRGNHNGFVAAVEENIGNGGFGQVGVLLGGFVHNGFALHQQVVFGQGGLGKQQEGATALGFVGAGKGFFKRTNDGGGVAQRKGAHPCKAFLRGAGVGLDFAPFLVDGFGDGVVMRFDGDVHRALGNIGAFGLVERVDV